jgi:hypothetical protein
MVDGQRVHVPFLSKQLSSRVRRPRIASEFASFAQEERDIPSKSTDSGITLV